MSQIEGKKNHHIQIRSSRCSLALLIISQLFPLLKMHFVFSFQSHMYLLSLLLKIYKALACQLWEFSLFPLNISYIIA